MTMCGIRHVCGCMEWPCVNFDGCLFGKICDSPALASSHYHASATCVCMHMHMYVFGINFGHIFLTGDSTHNFHRLNVGYTLIDSIAWMVERGPAKRSAQDNWSNLRQVEVGSLKTFHGLGYSITSEKWPILKHKKLKDLMLRIHVLRKFNEKKLKSPLRSINLSILVNATDALTLCAAVGKLNKMI